MDAEISKTTKKILEKQGMKFKLGTKVLEGDDSGETVKVKVEAAKGGKPENVCQRFFFSARLVQLTQCIDRRRCRSGSHRPPPLYRRPWP